MKVQREWKLTATTALDSNSDYRLAFISISLRVWSAEDNWTWKTKLRKGSENAGQKAATIENPDFISFITGVSDVVKPRVFPWLQGTGDCILYFRISTCTVPYMKHLEASCILTRTGTCIFSKGALWKHKLTTLLGAALKGKPLLFIYWLHFVVSCIRPAAFWFEQTAHVISYCM